MPSIERELDEERLSLLLPHLFHAKLSAETDPEEATALLELLGSAQQAIHRFADRALRIRSDVGLLIAEHGTVHADRLIKKYVETPSKAYSMLTRQHITQALHGVLEHIADEEALMEVRDPRAALGPETPGVLTEADIVLSRYDPPMMFHLPTSSIFGEHDQCRVRIAGPVVRVYDLDGRPRLRRRDTLPFGMRVAPAAITARGSLRGYIRVETDAHGALILDRSPSGKMIAVADVPEGTLPPESALTFECRGAEVRCSLPHGDLTLHVRDLREAAKRSREGVEISSANDVVLFKKVGCNIIFQAHGDDAAALGIPFIASRLAQVIHALEQTYPGKRLEYILPETLEVHAKPRHKLGAAAGSDQRGTTRLTVEDVHPAVLAAFLMHEDAHCLAAKVLGTIERYVAERFRGRRVFVGSKTPTEIVEEGVKEIFARLVQLRYLTDAVRGHAVTSQTVDAMVQELRSWILMDAEHFRSHDLLSERGVRLMGDFLAELADLEAAYAMDDCAAQEQEGGDDAEPLPYEIIRGGTRRAWEFFLSDLAEGMCTTALERYGLLPDPKRARIAGRAPLALPSPAASRLVSRESFVVRKKRTERIPKRNRSPQPSFSDYAAKHPEAWEQRASYREEWRAKVRDAKRMAGEESWDPDDDSDDD